MSNKTKNALFVRIGSKLTWPAVALLVLVLLAFSAIRSVDTFTGQTNGELFETRYLDHPIISGLHMLFGMLFILLAPLQFNRRFRSKNLNVHRQLGRVLLVCALLSGIYGIVSVVALPAFGGFASSTASWVFGPIFLFSLCRSFWCIRHKQINNHREWMIRAFAIGLAVGTQRVLLIIFMIVGGHSFEELFGPSLWMAFALNLILAETWINLTRPKR